MCASVATKQKSEPKLRDWYPLPTYSRELSDKEWVSEIRLRLGFKIAYENFESGKVTCLTFGNSAAKDVFLSILQHDGEPPSFISREEIDYKESWPVRLMTTFEGAFLAQLCRRKPTRQPIILMVRCTARSSTWHWSGYLEIFAAIFSLRLELI